MSPNQGWSTYTSSESTAPSALAGKHVALGISGGVAAYKAADLCRKLTAAGARVTPVLTDNAQRFVGRATFDALASEPAITSLWDDDDPSPHTTLARAVDLVVVAPATARIVSSLANGSSDDVLATFLIATRAPVVMCPAMHTEMWEHPSVCRNISALRSMGVSVMEPDVGPLAGGDHGAGRLPDPRFIVEFLENVIEQGRQLTGQTVLVTAGGTREPIDPVRFLGNRSSGKQGHAVAAEALAQGARVILVTASTLPAPPGSEVVQVDTAAQMHNAVMSRLADIDVLVMAAAVADFRPTQVQGEKIKKSAGVPEIQLEPTEDILGAVAQQRRPNQVIVGFAAETGLHFTQANTKLAAKQLDMLVANNVSEPGAGFEGDTNSVVIFEPEDSGSATGTVEKRTVAREILFRVAQQLRNRQS